MRLFTSLIATAVLFAASTAFAAANWTVQTSVASGNDLGALEVGDQITLNIGLTTTSPELLGISGSVNNYDTSVLQLNAGASSVSGNVLCEFFNAMFGGCINGQSNLESGVRSQVGVEGPGAEDTFLSLLSVTAAVGDGSVDEPFPQFTLVYDVIGAGATTLRVGTYGDYADAYSGGDNVVNNVEIAVVVPEPGTALLMGLGLAGLAAAGRRD